VEGCTEAIGEVGGFSLTINNDLRLYLIQTAEKGLAWLNLIADGRAGHGSFRNDDNAVTELAAAVARVGQYEWPHKITDAQRAFLEAVSEAFEIDLDPDRAEETLARLGSIARMVGATMSSSPPPGHRRTRSPLTAAAPPPASTDVSSLVARTSSWPLSRN
jgi:acetylornithine deacetylase/succinyl-diaminopimelate desuccinylase-like protein